MLTSPEAKNYHRIKNSLFVVNLLFSLAVLLAVIFSGFSIWLKVVVEKYTHNLLFLNGLY